MLNNVHTPEALAQLLWATNPALARKMFPKPKLTLGHTPVAQAIHQTLKGSNKKYPTFAIDGVEHSCIANVTKDTLFFGYGVWQRAKNYAQQRGVVNARIVSTALMLKILSTLPRPVAPPHHDTPPSRQTEHHCPV